MSFDTSKFFKLTVGKKLVFLIASLLFVAVAVLTRLSTTMFKQDTEALVQQMTIDSARHLAETVRLEIENLAETSRSVGFFLLQNPLKEEQKTPALNDALAEIKEEKTEKVEKKEASSRDSFTKQLFEKNKSLYGIFIFETKESTTPLLKDGLVFESLVKSGDAEGKNITSQILHSLFADGKQEGKEDITIHTLVTEDSKKILAVSTPFFRDNLGKEFVLVSVFDQNSWLERFASESVVSNFLIDQKGAVLIHPDTSLVNVGHNFSNLEIVKKILEGKLTNGQTRYWDEEAKEFKMGAFSLVGVGRLAVVSEVPEKRAFEAAYRLEYRAFLIASAILFLACGLGYIFSKSLTWPLKQLLSATLKVTAGDFSARITEKGKDEVSQLAKAFNKMTEGLVERDRVKHIFNKFHNKEIAEKILAGQVNLGGERKEAVIFFSDIRGFTAMSEQLSPEEVVVFLNEYMTQMVSVIRANGGIVDKYVGDAIMALWGVPLSSGDDAGRAVKACLEMREILAKYNEAREKAGKQPIYIGMGLNLGTVVAGNIGSEEKMEYTVIGDAVNTASRVESMTKEFGTDLLISQSIADKLEGRYLLAPCEEVKVKGKAESIRLFKVTGYKNGAGETVLVETKYSSYEPSKSDKSETPLAA